MNIPENFKKNIKNKEKNSKKKFKKLNKNKKKPTKNKYKQIIEKPQKKIPFTSFSNVQQQQKQGQ